MPSQKSHDNFQKLGAVAVNHINHDVVEVNSSDSPILPGSFLYEKEPGYEALFYMGIHNKFHFTPMTMEAAPNSNPLFLYFPNLARVPHYV